MMRAAVQWMERHQVVLYLLALAFGAGAGLAFPVVAGPAAASINPLLGLMLYATFLGVPMAQIGQAIRDWRFLATVLVVNFVVVPLLVFALSRFVAADDVLLVGVLFVLLTPCVDYVIAFTGLAGGAKERLLAAAPLLLLVQMLLLPLYLWLMAGEHVVSSLELAPFLEAFVFLIAVPLIAAALTQFAAARTRAGARAEQLGLGAMVPLLMATQAVVVAAQIHGVGQRLTDLLLPMPVYLLFIVVMVPIGALAGRIGGLDLPGRRAVVFSGVTRNSLVVLPLVLALPAAYDLASLVVVTQTLIELLAMVVFVRIIPRLLPGRTRRARPTRSRYHDHPVTLPKQCPAASGQQE